MKKFILIFTLFVGSFGFAQQEIKLDIGDALVIRGLEFSYERYLTDDSSFGVSALFNLEKEGVTFRYNENMVITPYYRHYFTTNEQLNFFGEGFFGINSGKKEAIKDSGDYDKGYGNLVVLEEGEYEGGYTGFPQFGVAFDVRNGDFLAMDVHEWHCNTKIKPVSKDYSRVSLVAYLRNNMIKCKGLKIE